MSPNELAVDWPLWDEIGPAINDEDPVAALGASHILEEARRWAEHEHTPARALEINRLNLQTMRQLLVATWRASARQALGTVAKGA